MTEKDARTEAADALKKRRASNITARAMDRDQIVKWLDGLHEAATERFRTKASEILDRTLKSGSAAPEIDFVGLLQYDTLEAWAARELARIIRNAALTGLDVPRAIDEARSTVLHLLGNALVGYANEKAEALARVIRNVEYRFRLQLAVAREEG